MAGRMQDGDGLDENHDINVTPFIDVMLVLLIIFMVAAPLATVDINVDLPASRGAASERPDQPVWLTVSPDLTLALGPDQISKGGLLAALEAATGGDRETRIFLRADKAVPYGEVMEVMNQLRDLAYTKIALVGLETAGPGAVTPQLLGTTPEAGAATAVGPAQ